MGLYQGQRENPCPRCGGEVQTIFISVGGMGFFQRCMGCKTTQYTEEEEKKLGKNETRISP